MVEEEEEHMIPVSALDTFACKPLFPHDRGHVWGHEVAEAGIWS